MWKILALILILFVIYRLPLKGEIPIDMTEKAKEIDRMSKDKLELVKNVYDYVNQSYTSPIRQYLQEPNKIFIKNIKTIWNLRGSYIPSNAQNEMAKQLLLLTGKFNESHFRTEQTFCEISPHSILFVNVDGKEIVLDLWFSDNGGMFNCYTFRPCGVEQIKCLN